MITTLSYGMAGLLMVCGCIYLAEQLCAWLWRPKELPDLTVVLPLSSSVENVEQVLRYYENWLKWKNPYQRRKILVVDQGLDSLAKEQCLCLMKEWGDIDLIQAEELEKRIQA